MSGTTRIAAIVTMMALTLWMATAAASEPPADLIVVGGPIYTMDERHPTVEMVAVRGDRIAYAGDRSAFDQWAGPGTRVIDLEGRAMTPGLIESHGHILSMGFARMKLDLTTAANYEEVVSMVAAAVANAAPGQWILGGGWHQSKWRPAPEPMVKGFQIHEALSRVSPDNPVFLSHASGHAGFANARAMRIAGITARTDFTEGGEIIKDQQGQPTGIFIESAQGLIRRHIPSPDHAQRARALELAMEEILANGITTFHDAASDREAIDLYREFLRRDMLRVRLWVMIDGKDKRLLNEWYARGPMIDIDRHRLTIRAIKLFADGALGSRGAWLLAPYSDRPGHSGHALIPMTEIYETAVSSLERGFQLCVHAIGDRANREVLDQMERALEQRPSAARDHRFRIEHAQHIDPKDIPRFAKSGVIASMQGIHFASDRPWAIRRLGKERMEEGAYAWQKLIQSGARVINGTDVPVEPIDPVANFYALVTRKTLAGQPPGGYEPDQRMTRQQALKAYTLHAAFAGFEEKIKGSIETDKLADFTIFSQDLMSIPEEKILDTRIDTTIIGGKEAYIRDGIH